MRRIVYREWRLSPQRFWSLLGVIVAFIALGGLATLYMEHEGHWVTGMTNEIVWGTPHIFAVFLVVAASGALNIASLGTVFNQTAYKPLGRLSALLSAALLVGGLLVLVLDLGRPERLIVAMTTYNFRSIFAWNIFLYTGLLAIIVGYLWTMADVKATAFNKPVGFLAFSWRLLLTTGTGSIFGFIVARQAYDTAVLAPLFIAMSFAYGLAIFTLVLMYAFEQDQRPMGEVILRRIKNLLGLFIGAVLLLIAIYFLTKIYGAKNYELVSFYLLNGGSYTIAFWLGWILVGCLMPLGIVFHPALGREPAWIAAACGLVVIGGLASMYVLIIGGQAYPMQLFPDQTVLESGFYDGVGGVASPYTPSIPEVMLGLGGVAVAMFITAVGVRVLQFLPESLEDGIVAPASAS